MNDNKIKHCYDCKSSELIEDSRQGMIVCTDCGSVQKDHLINEGDEGTNYDNGIGVRKNNTRHGYTDEFNPYDSLGTYIPKGTFVTITKEDGTVYRADLSKLNMMVSQNSKEKSYNMTVRIFEKLGYNQSIHKSVIDSSKRIWAEITKSSDIIYRGSNRKGILASCILYASYSTERPLNRDTLCEIMNIRKKDLSNGEPLFKTIVKNTKYKNILKYSTKDRSQKTFVKLLSDLDLDYSNVNTCIQIYNSVNIASLKENSSILIEDAEDIQLVIEDKKSIEK